MPRKSQRPQTDHTILVVDDQEETLISVRRLLEREGHRVLTADCGERALALFKEHDIHLLLVDYFMPRMTGEQLVREIRSFDPYVQIILQTGYSGEKPPRVMLADLDIQGYHDKAEGPEKLLVWVDVGLKAHRLISRLRERERLQRELVANVSHEFRTPLNIIGGYTELLIEGAFGPLPQTVLEPLGTVAAATSNLGDLVMDFLRYAKLEAGVIEISEQPIETAELAHELQRLGLLLLDEKDVRFAVDLDDAPPGLVTDSVKLRTILRNLISNAAKFTAAGAIWLRIALQAGALRLAVHDTGTGIRAQDLDVIFEPFRQIDGSSTRKHGGIGLGLALSRKLARLLGGDVEVESEPGVGSVFTLVLPATVAARYESREPAGAADMELRSAVGFS
jgi:signal transduction histidine kinase